jgi:hypothetical protein
VTTIPGVDYAWNHPGGAALQQAGKRFACRYLSADSRKNLTLSEAKDLAAHGISCVVVWESTANRALAGRAAGAADATAAAAQAAAAGMPGSRPIYFAVDFDASAGQQDEINAYLDGAASVLGRARVGIYGGYYPVKRALDAGKARWGWQTAAWSGGQWDGRAVIHQGAQMRIGGVACDLDTATAADYGQWTPGHAPTPPPAADPAQPAEPDHQEDDMPQPFNHSNPKDVPLPVGKWTTVAFEGADVLTRVRAYHATAHLTITGLTPGAQIQGRWYHQRPDGTRWTGPIIERSASKDSSFVDFPNEGSVIPNEKVRFEIAVFAPGAVLTSALARGLAWA